MERKTIGHRAENFVCDYLRKNNFMVLEQNWSCRDGEIDIIAKDTRELVFVEVRCRKENSLIKPMDSVSESKIKKISDAIDQYMADNGLEVFARLDFVGVTYKIVDKEPVFTIESHIKRIDLD